MAGAKVRVSIAVVPMLAPDSEARMVPEPTAKHRQAAGYRAQPTVEGVDHLGDQARSKQDLALQDEHRDRQQDEDRQAAIDAIDQKLEPRGPHEIAEENDVGAEEGEDDGNAEQDESKEARHQQ